MINHSKNILLVYPRIPKNTYWSFSYSLKFIGKKSSMPPSGLITVAAMLPKHHRIKLIDMNVEELQDEHLQWADAVFTSSMIIQKDSLEEVIARANKFNVPVVAGGPYPTQYYDQIKGVSHFVLGEAESGVLDAFLSDFETGKAKKAYARVSIRRRPVEKKIDEQELEKLVTFFGKDADIKVAETRPSMSASPIPKYDLLDMKKYGSMAVQMSRGCPGICDFCTIPSLLGHEPRVKTADRMVEEFEAIYNLGYRGALFVVDDNFIGSIKKAKDVLPKIQEFQKQHNFPFSLYTEASLNLARDPELMKMMRDAGFNMVFVGIESTDEKVLKAMNKHPNLRRNIMEDVRTIQHHGMEVTAGIIIGNDNDPEDICDKIFDFCQKAGIPKAMVGLLTAIRGSEMYERLKQNGRLIGDGDGDNTHNFQLNFRPLPGKDENKIIKGYENLLARLYDKKGKNYFERCKVLLDNIEPNPKSTRRIRLTELRAFGMSIWMQSYRSSYRSFLVEAALNHADLLPEAVALAIMGRHFRKITHNALKAHSINHYIQERYESFRAQADEAWQTKKAESIEWYNNLVEEKDAFLRRARKKISKLPVDYRPRLLRNYERIALSLNSMI